MLDFRDSCPRNVVSEPSNENAGLVVALFQYALTYAAALKRYFNALADKVVDLFIVHRITYFP